MPINLAKIVKADGNSEFSSIVIKDFCIYAILFSAFATFDLYLEAAFL